MDITKIQNDIDKYSNIKDEINERWQKLIGFGCGYFDSFTIEDGDIIITYEKPGGCYPAIYSSDTIPIEFFEIEDDKEAIEKYKEYRRRIIKCQ